jgi:hypothetical protein
MKKSTLSTTPIDMEAALYKGPIEYTKVAPCPFLTDETAEGTYKLRYGLESKNQRRLDVSNTECRWTYFEVRIPSEKNSIYRLNQIKRSDGEQALKPQDGPGNKAFLYYPKLRNKKKQTHPSGFIFSQGNKTIFISGNASSEPTSIKKLREVADEIATLLPKALKIKQQYTAVVQHFDACAIWDKKVLENMLETDKIFHTMGAKGGSVCSYYFYGKKLPSDFSKTFEFKFYFENNSGNKTACESRIKKGEKQLKGFSHQVVSRIYKSKNSIDPSFEEFVACFDGGNFYTSISGPDLRYTKPFRLLIKNVLSRVGGK